MRDLAIAYGNNRQAKKWVNKTISYTDLKERLKVTIRTTESAEEYAKMGKAQRDAAKDHGGFVGGVLAGGRRKVGAMSIPWTQKVELFSQHSICRENYFLCCQSLIFNLLWYLVIKSTMAPFSVVE